jgi:hypothetical protein
MWSLLSDWCNFGIPLAAWALVEEIAVWAFPHTIIVVEL